MAKPWFMKYYPFMIFKVKLCNKPQCITVFDAIIFFYIPRKIPSVFAIAFCSEKELWKKLLSKRTGTTWTFSTYVEQAAIKKLLFTSSMLWLYYYRKVKGPEQQETVLVKTETDEEDGSLQPYSDGDLPG